MTFIHTNLLIIIYQEQYIRILILFGVVFVLMSCFKSSSEREFAFFFFQAEDGIRDKLVTGVQTCALPICRGLVAHPAPSSRWITRDHRRTSRCGPCPPEGGHTPDSIALPQLAGLLGTPPSPHNVETSTSPRTRVGASWASCWATNPPKDRPSTSERAMSSRSSSPRASAANFGIVSTGFRATVAALPGTATSIQSNPCRCRRNGLHAANDIPIPVSSRIGGPAPLRRTHSLRPPTSMSCSDFTLTSSAPPPGKLSTRAGIAASPRPRSGRPANAPVSNRSGSTSAPILTVEF